MFPTRVGVDPPPPGGGPGWGLYLLRNLSRGSGIGFFEERNFYPDFILWIVTEKNQHIVFVEPHGMLHAQAYIHDEKAHLHERLPELATEIERRTGRRGVTLHSYIISVTPYDDLCQQYLKSVSFASIGHSTPLSDLKKPACRRRPLTPPPIYATVSPRTSVLSFSPPHSGEGQGGVLGGLSAERPPMWMQLVPKLWGPPRTKLQGPSA